MERAPVGVVLAGGASTRLGRDKSSLRLPADFVPERARGLTLTEWACVRLEQVCASVVVAQGERAQGSSRPSTKRRSVRDAEGVSGPVAGILGAARAHPGCSLLVLACDLPRVEIELLERLCETDTSAGDADTAWVVVDDGERLQFLCALYHPQAIACLENRVTRGRFNLWGLTEKLTPQRVSGATAQFLNINRPGDFEQLLTGR